MSFTIITDFENEIAKFFGSPYAIAVDCCTHAIELSLRHSAAQKIEVPHRTYISVPFLAQLLYDPRNSRIGIKKIAKCNSHRAEEVESYRLARPN